MVGHTPQTITEEADVVVVGFGAAGACAAITAREQGADVLVLDRANGGGATAISGGIIYAGAGTRIQQQAGVQDSVEQMLTYLRLEVGDAVRPETLERFVRTSPEMIDWLAGHGVPFDSSLCPYKVSYPNNRYYLYHSGNENSGAFRSHTPPVQRGHRAKGRGASGKKIFAPLAASARQLGVRLRPHTRVTALLQDASGRVTGVQAITMTRAPKHIQHRYATMSALSAKPGIYYPPLRKAMDRRLAKLERRHGRAIQVNARRGVIVCAGGFIANTDWVGKHAPQFTGGLALGTSGDDGSGIALAESAGAVTDRMDNVSAWRFITPPSAFISSIVVGQQGERILDETRYGAALGGAMVREHDGKGWILADAALMATAKRQLISEKPIWFQQAQAVTLLATGAARGQTLAEVAQQAGVDAEGLQATVKAHNDAIDSGIDDPAGKPAQFCQRIEKAPFTLLNISVRPNLLYPTPMLTLGGIRVAEDTGAVLDAAGTPIPGLFGAGRTALGICSQSYVSGLSISDCVFAGRRAGAAAASSS